MEILLKWKRWGWIGRICDIYIDGTKLYEINRDYLEAWWNFKIISKTNNELAYIKAHGIAIDGGGIINIENKSYKVEQVKKFAFKFMCTNIEDKNDKISVFGNHGYDLSLFRSDRQIGWARKNKWIFLEGHKYEIEINTDENLILICAIIFLAKFYRITIIIGGDFGLDLGNMGKSLVNRNLEWTPNKTGENKA